MTAQPSIPLASCVLIASSLISVGLLAGPVDGSGPASAPSAPSGTVAEALFGSGNSLDQLDETWKAWKERTGIPISVGAHHWWHVDRDRFVYGDGYGVPTERGTYYYYMILNPSIELDEDGFFERAGLHFQGRIRDHRDRIRPFFNDTKWIHDTYLWTDTKAGTFKGGKIENRFGIPWDYSWWEGVPYFDGYKFDPDWGLSWNREWDLDERFSVDTSLQFFFAEDGVNGSMFGADPESFPGFSERNTGVFRAAPKWKIGKNASLAWGLSGMAGELAGGGNYGITDDSRAAWGTDLTLTMGNWMIWGEYIDNHGTVSPARYVSGGPSDRQNSARAGVNFTRGWFGAHMNVSKGWDHNPSGEQWIVNPGITAQLTKNLTLYTEYVKWQIHHRNGTSSIYDDGFEFILNWHF